MLIFVAIELPKELWLTLCFHRWKLSFMATKYSVLLANAILEQDVEWHSIELKVPQRFQWCRFWFPFPRCQVETSTGSLNPASFERSTRCPDEIVRRLRVSASNEDPTWNGKLLETYDTRADRFVIAPCCWYAYFNLHKCMDYSENFSKTVTLIVNYILALYIPVNIVVYIPRIISSYLCLK